VLIAIAILTIALVMVGASFPVGVAMTANVTDRTIAAVVADQAFAMIKLHGLRHLDRPVNDSTSAWYRPSFMSGGELVRQEWIPFEDVVGSPLPADAAAREAIFAYPSDPEFVRRGETAYYWSALCRRELDASGNPTRNVRVVVFVSRKILGPRIEYPLYFERQGENTTAVPPVTLNQWPKPILTFRDNNGNQRFDGGDRPIFSQPSGLDSRTVNIMHQPPPVSLPPPPVQRAYMQAGSFILEDTTGELYRITDRRDGPLSSTFTLDRPLVRKITGPGVNYKFWVVPPAIGTTRKPCIAVYQKVIKF
ncbi:MAG TPA: hypothetical protein VLH60_05865, partial [Sedimentisphaerales bacterium]|nr:hypothetical protein [Sedimentisphaerales bacterium]